MTFLFYEYLAKSPSRNKKCQFKQKSFSIIKKYDISKVFQEVPPGFEPGIEVLQTFALPLGYGTIFTFYYM